MQKLYISTPVTSRPEEEPAERFRAARRRCGELIAEILTQESFREYCPVTPFHAVPAAVSESRALGYCITAVLNSAAIYMDDGWEHSPGCRLEHFAALLYKKQVFYRTPRSEET